MNWFISLLRSSFGPKNAHARDGVRISEKISHAIYWVMGKKKKKISRGIEELKNAHARDVVTGQDL